jgi:hypothetical protein
MNRLSVSIIHCDSDHSKPNGYQNHQTRRSGHHQEGDLETPLTLHERANSLDEAGMPLACNNQNLAGREASPRANPAGQRRGARPGQSL